MHFKKLIIREVRKETDDCVSILFDVPESLRDAFRFSHGQNLTVKATIEGEEIRRSYSICSSPLENELRIAVKKVEFGKFSTHANSHLQKGDELEVLPPTGNFFTGLDRLAKKNYLAFAAGSGITPVISIIKTVLVTEPGSSFTLIFGNRSRSSIIFKEELDALKNKYLDRFILHHILSREKTDALINYGHIDPGKCTELSKILLNPEAADEIFLCGPEQMIFSVKSWLEARGIVSQKIHFELFATPKQRGYDVKPVVKAAGSTGADSRVTIRLDGVAFDFDLPFDGEPILDAALKQGADLPYACKGGVCSTCRARLLTGQVEMETNYALEPEELKAGFILTCQSHPVTDRVVVDFDSK